jgi:hypothetical protein
VNWSAALVALVPLELDTVTSTVPLLAGEIAVIDELVLTVKAAGLLPKLTDVTPLNSVPTIATLVPPVLGPLIGETEVIVGSGAAAVHEATTLIPPLYWVSVLSWLTPDTV